MPSSKAVKSLMAAVNTPGSRKVTQIALQKAVDALFAGVAQSLKDGKTHSFRGFGSFRANANKQSIEFTPSKALKAEVFGDTASTESIEDKSI
eukprot:GILJ01001822.1.p1 GENE.GILJ01001822.1~~GILJ01001822.1.p1  ORF type:complete len:106 (-),score=20.43 GILJ01001822.1:127-405(-)